MTPISSPSWAIKNRIWELLRIEQNSLMIQNRGVDDVAILVQSKFNQGKGFEAHLNAVEIFLRRVLGQESQSTHAAAKVLLDGHSKNPFFHFLVHGRDLQGIDLIIRKCPGQNEDPNEKNVWIWEQAPLTEHWRHSKNYSMGWDCVFAIGLHGVTNQKRFNEKVSLVYRPDLRIDDKKAILDRTVWGVDWILDD